MNTQEAIKILEKELKWIKNPVSTNDPKSPTAQALTHAIEVMKRYNKLVNASKAVVRRWDTPLWKDVEHTGVFINNLRNALTDAPEVKE